MPSENADLRELEKRLNILIGCILDQAKQDDEFAARLFKLFNGGEVGNRPQGERKRKNRSSFNPVEFLSTHDVDSLRRELEGKPRSELSDIIRAHRVIPTKAIKTTEHAELIRKLIDYAGQKLNQGGVFLRSDTKSQDSSE